jgi:hypothetical protein
LLSLQIEYLTTKFKPFKGATAGNVGVTNPEFSAEKNKLAAGKTVVIGINKDMNTVKISTKSTVSKAYIKYLVKKFLKKNLLREHIRVVAPTKNSLNLRFFAMQADNSVEA